MDERAAGKPEERLVVLAFVPGLAVEPVLVNGVTGGLGEESARTIVVGGVALGVQPAVGGEVGADFGFEIDFLVEWHWPVVSYRDW